MKIDKIVRQPTITSQRFNLRPLRDGDAEFVALYANDQRVAQMTSSIPHPLSREKAAEFVTRSMANDRDEDVWALDGSEQGGSPLLGIISLQAMDRGQSEIGFWVAPAFWNHGYASEAIAALMAANPQNNKSVVACVFQDNPTSARILSAAGFINLGEAEAFSVARGTQVPTWTYLKKI